MNEVALVTGTAKRIGAVRRMDTAIITCLFLLF